MGRFPLFPFFVVPLVRCSLCILLPLNSELARRISKMNSGIGAGEICLPPLLTHNAFL